MTRDETVRERTVARFLECEEERRKARDAALQAGKLDEAEEIAQEAARGRWNTWAEDMLAKRKALEESGEWAVEQLGFHGDARPRRLRRGASWPKTAETHAWMEEAEASFSRCLFFSKGAEGTKEEAPGADKVEVEARSLPVKSIAIEGGVADFRGFLFPGDAWFDGAAFSGTAAMFTSATFSGNATFDSAAFSGEAQFHSAIFSGNARFDGAAFSGIAAMFDSATFSGLAWFSNATFSGLASFASATFSGFASFHDAIFSGLAWFDDAAFSGTAAMFVSASFSGHASFASATFSDGTTFVSATFSGETTFASATFTKSTSFRDAKFGAEEKKADADFTAIRVERTFNLSGTYFSRVPSFRQADFRQAPDLDGVDFPLPPAGPLTSGDKDLVPKYRAIRRMAIQSADYDREQRAFKGEMRSRRWKIDKFWHPEGFFGWFYDWAADCGRSIIRPFAFWLLSVFVFAVLYLLPSGKNVLDRCVPGHALIFIKSLYISGRNALVLSSGGKDDRITQAYKCLFGDAIPDGVSFVESFVQVPLSAVLIFLFLLAVKNRFKIK